MSQDLDDNVERDQAVTFGPPFRASRQQLEALAAYIPVFEHPAFTAGTWVESKQVEVGVSTFPYYNFSEQLNEFHDMCYREGWVLMEFDWMTWEWSPEAEMLVADLQSVDGANSEQLARLLTTILRKERFSDGAIAEAIESELVLAILRRASGLATSR